MQFTRNQYKKLKQSQMFLANPNKDYIDVISGASDIYLKIYAVSLSELSFKIYEYDENGQKNSVYDLIDMHKLVELHQIAWFQVQEIKETHDEKSTAMYKNVKCYTLENELIGKNIYNITGTYALYDITDTQHSLLHIIMLNCGWTVGHIDTELLSKWRVFDLDSDQIYNLLTGKVAETFECIFQFDTYYKTINAYTLNNFGRLTNITISNKNILKQFEKTANADDIVTKIRVLGGTNTSGTQFDIRAVTIDGSDTIVNVSYYMNVFDSVDNRNGWMSQGLVNGLTNYNNAIDYYNASYTTNLNLLKGYKADLTTLNTELTEINSQISTKDGVMGSIVNSYTPSRTPISGETGYTIYQAARTEHDALVAQKIAKESQIVSKKAQITAVESTLNSISDSVNINNFLNSEQLEEYETFIKQGEDYVDDTFLATDTMSDEEVIELKLQLKSLAENKLATISRPQYTFDTSLSNLFTIMDEGYEDWQDDCEVGNLITLMFRENYWVTVRLMAMEFDFNNLEEIKLTFSDKSRLDDKLTQLAETIKQSGRTSSSFSIGKYAYNAAASNTSDFLTFKNGVLDATKNKYVSSDKEDIQFGSYGLRARQWNDGTNDYSPFQMWLTSNVLMFSDDGFNTSNSAFGRLIAPDGSTVMGINTDYLIGRVVLTENLYITNQSGNYNFNKDGFTATATVGSNTYLVGINPSTPSTIFRIAVNGSNKFYIDTVTNNLVFSGNLQAAGGTFSGSLNAATGTFSGSLSAASGTFAGNLIAVGGTFTGTLQGVNGTFSGTISASTITSSTLTGADIKAISFEVQGSSSAKTTITGLDIDTTYISCTNVDCSTLNGSTPVTYSNVAGSHTHNSSNIIATVVSSSYINFNGGNAAGYQWVINNFEPKSSSDRRLKKNIVDLSLLPIEIYLELNPVQFEFIDDPYNNGIVFGFIAQDVIDVFNKYGYNALDYNLVQKVPIRMDSVDESKYIEDGFKYIINYTNIISWNKLIIKKMWDKLQSL